MNYSFKDSQFFYYKTYIYNNIYIAMPMYNLIEYSDSYSDTPETLWKFKRDEVPNNNADLTADNSQSFRYKASLVGKTANAVNNTNSSVKTTKIVVSLKYLINFWRSLEMSLINCKIHLKLNLIEDCILSFYQVLKTLQNLK